MKNDGKIFTGYTIEVDGQFYNVTSSDGKSVVSINGDYFCTVDSIDPSEVTFMIHSFRVEFGYEKE